MRNVQIVDCPDGSYRYAAVDRQTGDFLLRLSDRAALLALCYRLNWVLHEQAKPRKESRAGAPDSPKRTSEQRWSRRKHRAGGATKYTNAYRRRMARLGF
jgi:hypothetical protein